MELLAIIVMGSILAFFRWLFGGKDWSGPGGRYEEVMQDAEDFDQMVWNAGDQLHDMVDGVIEAYENWRDA